MSSPYGQRIAAIRERLDEWRIDALLVTHMVNCRWLSGFTGSAGSLLITRNSAILATDSRYWEQAQDQAPDYSLFHHQRRPQDTAALLDATRARVVGLEAHAVTIKQLQELEGSTAIAWRSLDHPIESLRSTKTRREIDSIQAAAAITDTAMTALPSLLETGISEKWLAWLLEKEMRELGADGMAFPPIVAFGENSARPHHDPGERTLRQEEIVLVDMGARLNGYCSDLTRTFWFGSAVDSHFLEIYDIVLAAQSNALSNIRPGLNTQEAYALANATIADSGYEAYFGHGLGHGLGLEIHEEPFLSATREAKELGEGMTVTVEPGVYIPGWGGVRLEDLAQIESRGTRLLSHCLKIRQL